MTEKDDEARMRDRLMNSYEVAPALRLVDTSIAAVLAVVLASLLGLGGLPDAANPDAAYSPTYLGRLGSDDEMAANEQRYAQRKLDCCGALRALVGGEEKVPSSLAHEGHPLARACSPARCALPNCNAVPTPRDCRRRSSFAQPCAGAQHKAQLLRLDVLPRYCRWRGEWRMRQCAMTEATTTRCTL